MAYNGGFPEQQRPYAGPAAQRPAPRGGAYPPPQKYDQYQDDYGYGGGYDQQYDGGYGGDYGAPQDMNYGRGGPPPNQGYPQQDYYGPGPGPGRGGARPPPGRGGRGGLRGGGPSRGGFPGPMERSASSDLSANPGGPPLKSPGERDFGSPFPVFPGQQRKTDLDQENQILDRMAALEVGGSAPAKRPGMGPNKGNGGSGPGPGPGPQGGPAPRRGPSSMDDYGGPGPQGLGPEPRRRGPSSMDDYGGPGPQGPGSEPRRRGPSSMDDYGGPGPQGPGPEPRRRGPSSMDDYGGPGPQGPGPEPRRRGPSSMDDYGGPGPQGPGPEPRRRGPSMDDFGGGPGPQVPGPARARGPSMDDYGGRRSMDSQRGGPRGPPPQGYPNGQRGPPPPDQGYEGGYRDNGYEEYGPPGRSMTVPNNPPPMGMGNGMRNGGPPRTSGPHADSAPYNGPVGRNMPPRPSTAQGNRPPPQRMYPNQGPVPAQYDAYEPPNQAWANEPPVRASFGDFYDAYYDQRSSGDHYPPPRSQSHEIPDFDAAPAHHVPRGSFDQHMRPGQPGPGPGLPHHPGPARVAELSRTKSQPNLREPQAAVFEMAQDMPPVPNGGFQAYNPGVGGPAGPPGPQPPMQMSPPQNGLGSGHPAPIRPGLMPNSMVNLNDKAPPQRQYTGPPPAAVAAQGRPQPRPVHNGAPPEAEHVPVTTEELEQLRAVIKADPNDQESALKLAKRLIEAADVLAPRLPDAKARARSRERYILDAHKILKKLVSAQNADAMFFLADSLGRGILGFEPDNKEAFTLYQSAAKLGNAPAAYRTAVCCEIGNDDGGGTRKDPLKAIQWYKRAATLGDTPAMYKVGMILLKGLLGQPKNPREAVGWLKRAAERADAENPHALHELGLLYESAQPNDVILRDEPYALSLFEQAAQLGYKFSQFRMGCAFEYGLMGCPIDPRLSIMWYSRAATQEEHQSELALSGWYLTGSDGVLQQSDTEAYLWARKAAQAGLAKAEYAMGYFTEVGIGVPANMEDAKRWYWRAAAQDFPKARDRLEDLKRSGKSGPRQRERISRSKIGKQQEGECSVM